ncbi:MAG TPA: GTP-binding protein, partial [Rugosimonospora sp.]|nr:GTP-binding protein [Rugosimonospora sp.]
MLALAGAAERTPVPVAEAARYAPDARDAVHADIGIPRDLLRSGLVLIDTPPGWARTALVHADAVLMVSDATGVLGSTEVEFLRDAARWCPNVILAVTKTDMCPQWRDVAERDRELLAGAGVPARLVTVSASLRAAAAGTGDAELNDESGFPELVRFLAADVLAKPERWAPRGAAAVVGLAIEELAAPLRTERSIVDSEYGLGVEWELREAQRKFDELRRHSARWQNTLADEVADLVSDIEYDLRDRTRGILRAVDEFFDSADPAAVWDGFQPWLEENLLSAAEANFGWLVARADWIARKIAAGFPAYRDGALPRGSFWVPPDAFGSVGELPEPLSAEFRLAQKVFTGLRGSYGGLVMFGLLTSLAGMPLVNAVSLGAGALFGGKSLRDEGDNRRVRRQMAAKAAVQRHVEDFFLKFCKDCRDVVRQMHRTLRDHFTAVAEEIQDELIESARVAKQHAERGAAERARRNREIERELDALAALHGRARLEGGAG